MVPVSEMWDEGGGVGGRFCGWSRSSWGIDLFGSLFWVFLWGSFGVLLGFFWGSFGVLLGSLSIDLFLFLFVSFVLTGGEMVTLKKGTFVQVVNWTRHRNPRLWGPDVNEFNPDREWQGNEIWGMSSAADENGQGAWHGSNPASPRFSPFTFTPRDCLGKNFAQMEMRTILANVFRKYDVVLSEPYR